MHAYHGVAEPQNAVQPEILAAKLWKVGTVWPWIPLRQMYVMNGSLRNAIIWGTVAAHHPAKGQSLLRSAVGN